MLELEQCKGCLETVHLSEEETKQVFGDVLRVKGVKLSTTETYRQRLETCYECSALQYDTTCKYCGCIVQVKAKLLNSKCPYPYNPKW